MPDEKRRPYVALLGKVHGWANAPGPYVLRQGRGPSISVSKDQRVPLARPCNLRLAERFPWFGACGPLHANGKSQRNDLRFRHQS